MLLPLWFKRDSFSLAGSGDHIGRVVAARSTLFPEETALEFRTIALVST